MWRPNAVTIQRLANAYGVPSGLTGVLSPPNRVMWGVGGPGYNRITNRIRLPASYYVPGSDNVIRSNFNSRELPAASADIFNELWHAWYDQVLEYDENCEWLENVILEAGRLEYPLPEYATRTEPDEYSLSAPSSAEVFEEAASETIANIVFNLTSQTINRNQGLPIVPGTRVTYDTTARSPGHGRFALDPRQNTVMSPNSWRVIVYALERGCSAPAAIRNNPDNISAGLRHILQTPSKIIDE